MNKVKLGDCIELIIDNRGKTPPLAKTGYELIETASINGSNKYPDYSKITKFVSEETYNTWFRKGHPTSGDILISTVGMNIGDVVIMKSNRGSIAQNLIALRTNNKLNSDYLYYILTSKNIREKIRSLNIGSAQPSLKVPHLLNIEFYLPNIEKQSEISKILNELDEKIEINTQINQTLEQIAQTIFKSWFIDFDPVHAKANALANGQTAEQATQAAMAVISGKNTQELHRLQTANPEQYQQLWEIAEAFPSGFDEEGVPWGWEMTTFGNVSQCFDKKRIPLSKRQREQRAGSIPYYGATSVMDYVDEAIFDDIYLLIGEDGSVLKEDGTPFIQYIWGKAWVNNHAHVLQGKGSVSTEQLMLFMASTNITAYVTGAVQMKLNQANMNSIPFVKATDRVNELFFDLIKDLYAKIRSNTDENRFLVKIREELLPKLLSGEILNGN